MTAVEAIDGRDVWVHTCGECGSDPVMSVKPNKGALCQQGVGQPQPDRHTHARARARAPDSSPVVWRSLTCH